MIYEVIMSKGEKIKIDEEDLVKIKENLSANLIRVKQGIINPSFMVMIVPTNEADVISKPIVEIDESSGVAVQTGVERIAVLADKMSDVKKLTA